MSRVQDTNFSREREFVHQRLERLTTAIRKGLPESRVDVYEARLCDRIDGWTATYQGCRSKSALRLTTDRYSAFVRGSIGEALDVQEKIRGPTTTLLPPIPEQTNPWHVAAAAVAGFTLGALGLQYLPPVTQDIGMLIAGGIPGAGYATLIAFCKR